MTTGLVRSFGFAVVVAVGTLGAPAVASTSLISLGASTSSFLFQTNLSPPGTVNVNTQGLVIPGSASFQNDSGVYQLGNASFFVGPQNGNQFPAFGPNTTESFTYTGTTLPVDTDKLTGTITWSFLQDGTTPQFFGSLLVNTVAGDAAFMAAFMAGQTYGIDLITQALGSNTTCLAPCTLEEVANPATGAARTTALVGSGAVTPLPGALPLLATGLGALGLLGWRRKQKAQAVA
jgi:hypothetical protein